MKRIFYITRTLPEGNTGGALIRRGSVNFLKDNGYHVTVVAPFDCNEVTEDKVLIKGPCGKLSLKWNMALFGLGLKSDYLEIWAHRAFDCLKTIVKKEDVVLATSGGELGTLMLASYLKQLIGCRTIYNLHDPVDYTLIEGEFSFQSKFKIKPRDVEEERVFKNADSIVTSSAYYASALKEKYPTLADRITCHHFGFIKDINNPQKELLKRDVINVVYGGNMSRLQGPEILIEVARLVPNVNFTLIGNAHFESIELPANVTIYPSMKYEDYAQYLIKNADIGFFSLVGNVAKLCVPSKLYEYINVGLPILAAIKGDAREIVNSNQFGIATNYNVNALAEAINTLLADNNLERVKKNILDHRNEWYMGNTIKELIEVL